MPKFVLLWTDAAIWLMLAAAIGYIALVRRRPNLVTTWRKVFAYAPALASSVVLALGILTTLADSVHFRAVLPSAPGAEAGSVAYDTRTQSLLDALRSRSRVEVRVEVDPDRLRPTETTALVADTTRLRDRTGWQPQISFESMLDHLLEYWRTAAQL